jgi:hypothetical protein
MNHSVDGRQFFTMLSVPQFNNSLFEKARKKNFTEESLMHRHKTTLKVAAKKKIVPHYFSLRLRPPQILRFCIERIAMAKRKTFAEASWITSVNM